MKTEDIKNTKDFINFLSRVKDSFLPYESEEKIKAISRTAFHSEVLYILPETHDLKNIANYNNIKFVEINNYKIDQKGFKVLKDYKDKFENVKFLIIWNIKQNDLELLEIFPNVTHLLISHIGKADFSYKGLDYLNNLETVVLSSVNKITDFNFLTKPQKEKIKHLNLTYTANLTKLDGIEDYKNLKTLTLFASTMESRKTVNLESLKGLEKLSNLEGFEIDYFNFDMEELKEKLKPLKKLKHYKVKNDTHENL